jgi:hypothetical protein
MNLTTAQKTALVADINGNPTLVALLQAGNLQGIAGYYNLAADPAWTVWRSSVTKDEIMLNGFDWTRLDNLSVGKYRIWAEMFDNDAKAINPSKANVRAGIEAVWVGTAADLAVRAVVYTHCKRFATRFERLFSTGTGSDASPASPDLDADGELIEGAIGFQVIASALG